MKRSARKKGDILEDLVAMLFEDESLVVEKRVRYPAADGKPRYREFDIVVSGRFAGQERKLVIECKNLNRKVNIEDVSEFMGSLTDAGILHRDGIMVSSKGFRENAINCAIAAGIRTLNFKGLSTEQLSAEMSKAIGHTVFVLLSLERFEVIKPDGNAEEQNRMIWFYNENGQETGCALDLVWALWRDEEIGLKLGQSRVDLGVPDGWSRKNANQQEEHIVAVIRVSGLVATQEGWVSELSLSDVVSGSLDRGKVQFGFEAQSATFPLVEVDTEEQLSSLFDSEDYSLIAMERIRLPRVAHKCYWPPSARSMRLLQEMTRSTVHNAYSFSRSVGVRVDPYREVDAVLSSLSLSQIEGTDISSVWDPILPGHPAVSGREWPYP